MSIHPAAGPRPELTAAQRARLEARLRGLHQPPSLPRRAPGGPVPLSFAQERLYFVHRMDPESAAYNVRAGLRLPGEVCEAALERALAEVVRRHEALRTTFRETDGVPAQVVAPFAGFRLPAEDLSALPAGEREAAVARRSAEEAERPFDLGAGPVFRAVLLRVAADERVLLLAMHHVVSDGWSMGVLFRELAALYAAFRDGLPSPLPELPVQYGDHAAWQRRQLSGEALERHLAYWRGRLAGAPARLELPVDHPRPAAPSYRGASVALEVDARVLEGLRDLARAEGATLFMVTLAAFQSLLAAYAGTGDVVAGTPVAGRTHREVEGVIGLFANTLVVRAALDVDGGFREALARVRESVLGAYEHQDLPFDRLVAELHPDRSPAAQAPLFQAMFTLEGADAAPAPPPGMQVAAVDGGAEVAKFDLSLALAVTPRGLGGGLVYATDLFERATVERMARHLERVLRRVAADPDLPLSALALPDADERAMVVDEWNRRGAGDPPSATIHALFAEQAARSPDAVALVCGGDALTYGELRLRANRLARHLRRRGVGPEDRVGVCMERGTDLVVSILAVLAAGGAYVPLDPGYPAARLALMAADARLSLVLAGEGAPALPDGIEVVRVDGEAEAEIGRESGDDLSPAAEADGLAYVMYTSGSTGTPKGVAVEHRAVVRLVRGADYARFGADEVVLAAAPVSFDASTLELWAPLLNGGRVVMLRSPSPTLEELGRALREHAVTTLWLTAGLFAAMVEERLDDLAGVRQLLAGGDVLPAGQVARLRQRFPGCRLINGYGPTENTTFTCCYTVPDSWSGGPVPVGPPISGTRVYVLDGGLDPLGPGVPGELYAGGHGVARGYLGRPALTAERFLPDPFAGRPGARMYRTGDRARWREDGAVAYLGRADAQVKVRGFRLEPGEIEAALRRHPAVSACAVLPREDAPGDRRLVAYVVGAVAADELRAHLRAGLPEYMVPSAFVALPALPLTPNGKVDRAALPAPEHEAAAERYVAPSTPAEEVLAEIWAAVLRVERVGARDDFFALGGHSLLATRLVSRIRDAFGVELPLRALFEAPTVATQAERIEELRRADLPQLPPVRPAPRDGALPLSFAQERLWFLDRLEPGGTAYNIAVALRLQGALDAAALERALGGIVRRHEALRTTFAEADGAPVQVIAPFSGFALEVEEAPGLGVDGRDGAIRRFTAAHAARPFDLAAGPLFRAALLRLDDGDHALHLGMHHVVSDGWSMGVLFRELRALYAAETGGAAAVLPDLAVQYADYAAWQRGTLRGEVLERQMAYWRERLAGAPAVLELPTDRPRPAARSLRGDAVAFDLPPELLEGLRALGRREGATLYMVLLGAFQLLLARYTGGSDVVVGTPVAGRGRGETEELIGFFVNTLVLRTRLDGDPAFGDLLRRVRETMLGAYEHQDLPFERLVAELHPDRTLSHSPLFQVLFTVENADPPAGALPGVRVTRIPPAQHAAKFDLSLAFSATAEGLSGTLEYSTDLFDRSTVARMVEHLRRVLEQVAGGEDTRISALRLIGDEERVRVVEEWNATAAAYPAERCIHQLFEEQAERTPGAVAVTFPGGAQTYRELDRAANRIAHRLLRLGVGPEVRVGICLERGPELLVAILGVMKSGGAYVPVDPSHPAERLDYVFGNSGVSVVLTQDRLRERLPALEGVEVIALDAEWDALAAESADAPETGVASENLCYVIYTSGSTGRPKGVAMHHRGVVNYIAWAVEAYDVARGNGSPVFSSMAVDLTITNLLPLFAGKPVHLLPEENAVETLGSLLREERRGLGVIKITPIHLQLLTALLSPEEARAAAHTLVIGAEVLTGEQTAFWRENAPAVRLVNEYGPTETVVGCSAYTVPGEAFTSGPIPVGGAIQNLTFFVLDGRMQPVPAGLPGELYIGGAGVARGYLGRPSLTAEKFVPDPFAGGGARMYRTGDRARWLDGGNLTVLGRIDHQVKVRGYRVELGEIEAVVRRHPAVTGALVVVREDVPGDRRLVAYVAGEAETDELRESLRAALPEYMVPSAFVRLDALPKTATGKIDPKTLPAPEYTADDARYVAPRTPTEEVLAGIWTEVLGARRVGVAESFFDAGGHSLLATRVVSRVREVLGVELPLRALFETPTVAALAARVDEARRAGLPIAPPVRPADRSRPLPLSFAQERLWFLDRLQPGGTAYNLPAAFRLRGRLDADALRRALGEVVRRHEALRTTFAEMDGAPVQVVAPFAGVALPVDDLSSLPADVRPGEVARRADADAALPFDLHAGPLFRATLLRVDEEEHVLLIAMHHVVGDEWSMGVLFGELAEIYAAFAGGLPSPLAEPALQYADWAAWQRGQLGEVLDAQLAYWRERLAGAPELLELPADRPRPPAPSFRGDTVPVLAPPALLERLQGVARAEGVTLYMLLLGAFQVLLSRYGAGDDVVVGSPVAGRTRAEAEALVGFFVNTVVLRADLGGDPDLREVLRRVREAALGAYEHQEVPFEKLVSELQPGRSLSHSPLFQVTFALHQAPRAPSTPLPELSVETVDAEVRTAKFDLSLGLAATPHGLSGGITYATDLFDRATVERMAGHLVRVLEQVAEEPALRLSTLALMGGAERAAVVEEWTRGLDRFAVRGTLHGRFSAEARRTPDAVALTCDGASLTYAELEARSGRVARALRRLGVGPEVRVGLCLERSADIVVALLGVLKAGGAYVPVDPAYPADRIAWVLEDSGVAAVVAQPATRAAISAVAAPVVDLHELVAAAGEGDDDVSADVDPETAAYVIYTSGSTGRPKGVVVTHANVLRLFSATDSSFGFGAGDVWTLFHSYAFDFSVWEIWGALLYGGRLVVVPFAVSRDPAAFRALLARERVTVLNQTPSAFRQLIRADEEAGGDAGELSLRWVVFGGEALEPRSLLPWFRRHGDTAPRLVNMYGITETTVHVTFREVPREDAENGAGSMVGTGIGDLGVYLLDGRMEPVPHGVPGEIFVGGAGVARGYLGRPALTAQRFVPDPFSAVPGARMYRSGDRARRRAAGDAEYLGRGDQQVKVRGFRIEPGEIESALAAEPGVREAVVLAREDEPGTRRLVAYVVPASGDGGEAPTAGSLRAGLAARLPDYMVPAAFVLLERIPLTAHGKVDRRALPAPDATRLAAADYVPPRGPVEEALARVWAETLGVDRVGAHDNYFALGGDSMRAIQLLARARAAGLAFSLQDLFRRQTVAELAEAVGAPALAPSAADAGAFALLSAGDRERVPAGAEDAYPMTQLQLGMLFHAEQHPEQAVYHNVQTFLVRAGFDEARLRAALAALAARHPVLRTRFDLAGFSEPVQIVERAAEIPLAVTSLEHQSEDEREAAIEAWMRDEREKPFDWRAAPLIRFHVHVVGADAFQFGITEHHAILDGWSMAVMQSELFALYFTPRAPLDAPPPPAVPRDFVALEREVLASAPARAFWAELLDGAVPVLPASVGGADGEGNRARGGLVPPAVTARLAELARREGVPLRSILLAAHLRVLASAAGTADVTTGVVVNGRPEGEGADRALGLYLNTIPFRLRLGGGGWTELVRATFRAELAGLPFRRFPTAELQRMRGGEPPFATLFNYVHFHVMDGVASSGEAGFGEGRGIGATNFAFGASFEEAAGGVYLSVEYDAARFSDAWAGTLYAAYLAVLERIAEDPDGRTDAVHLLPARSPSGAASAWAGDAATADATLHGLVAAQARLRLDAPALEGDGRTLTRAELDARAGRLARLLRERGVGPETRVGVCTARSPDMVVAALAVMRAGGVYVPLDPAHPPARLAFVAADAGLRLVLAGAETAGAAAATGVETLLLDDAIGGGADGDDGPCDAVEPGNAAYVIYTSGSTGTPKGVVVEHGAAAAHVATFAAALGLAEGDRVLHSAAVGFDVSVEQMFLPLAAGATLVVGGGAAWTPGEWARGAAELAVTVADLPPAYLQEVVESAPPPLPALRVLLTGADAVPSALVRRWQGEVETGARLVNAYGPTEAVVTATAFAAPDGFPDGFAGPVAPIGTALPGRAAYLLDPFGAPAADGVPGELCLGGVLARGYLGRPALTAERFVPDPFSATPGARMYRTGDRVRFAEVREYGSTEVRRSHGADEAPVLPYSRTFVLQFLGRIDAQVKVRGFRVEPGEVEAALALHPAVREAAVVARGGDGDRRLVGYVVPAPGAETPSPAALRAHLRERLPEWMVPSAFVAMDGFPLTANGKLDRAALPDPAAGGDDEAYVAPRDALELRLAQAWEALLGVPRVGVRDDFFALGGHSLLAMRALAAVERATGRRVPLATLLAGPTVERLARALRDGAGFPAPGPLVPLQPAGTRRPLFLVHAAGGNVVSYAALARRLGADQPVYGLQSRGVDGGEEPAASVEAMARDYLAEVRRTQPAGPYRLGGWSMGGLVAFEMARLLEADGERVELLALVDSPAPEEGAPLPDPDDPRLLASFVLHLGLPPERITLSAAEAAALPPAERLRLAWEAALAADVVAAELGMDGFRRLWTVFRANAAAAAAYRPERCSAALLLLVAEERAAAAASEAERWGALAAGGVRAAVVPGDHFTLVREPHVGRLAQHLAAALAAAEEEP